MSDTSAKQSGVDDFALFQHEIMMATNIQIEWVGGTAPDQVLAKAAQDILEELGPRIEGDRLYADLSIVAEPHGHCIQGVVRNDSGIVQGAVRIEQLGRENERNYWLKPFPDSAPWWAKAALDKVPFKN